MANKSGANGAVQAAFNEKELLDKIHACWIGKSIGGTLGTPYEGRREMQDVQGFASKPGRPLPNDDLDLQLVWLRALEAYGPLGVNERVLGEYWINYIPPYWNEYGIGKANMKAGLMPPLSGEYKNHWKHSNGAWIRSEIWACVAPAHPALAARYAYFDACVDHGMGEGLYAEIFTAAVESAAFAVSDRDALIDIGLGYIPKSCRVARSIGIALEAYRGGQPWQEARRLVVEDSQDLGWFQAPANVAFVVIGWLYGEGDYKKSVLTAINCGDDTDCTGATLGALLGIIGGRAGLPKDWIQYVGDDIVSVAIDRGSIQVPATCTELADATLALCKQTLAAHKLSAAVGEKLVTALPDAEALAAPETHLAWLAALDGAIRYDFVHASVYVTFPNGIDVRAGGEADIVVRIVNRMPNQQHYDIAYHLPPGFALARGPRHAATMAGATPAWQNHAEYEALLHITLEATATEAPAAVNRGIVEIVAQGRPTVMPIPFVLYGE